MNDAASKPNWRYIYGSSNICKFFDINNESLRNYNLVRATNMKVLEQELRHFKDNGRSIIISMVENAISDGIKSAQDTGEALKLGKSSISFFFLKDFCW